MDPPFGWSMIANNLKCFLSVFCCFYFESFCFPFFQFPGGLPPPGLSSALGLPPSGGVPPRLDLPPGVSMGQPNAGNNMNHEKVKSAKHCLGELSNLSKDQHKWRHANLGFFWPLFHTLVYFCTCFTIRLTLPLLRDVIYECSQTSFLLILGTTSL